MELRRSELGWSGWSCGQRDPAFRRPCDATARSGALLTSRCSQAWRVSPEGENKAALQVQLGGGQTRSSLQWGRPPAVHVAVGAVGDGCT